MGTIRECKEVTLLAVTSWWYSRRHLVLTPLQLLLLVLLSHQHSIKFSPHSPRNRQLEILQKNAHISQFLIHFIVLNIFDHRPLDAAERKRGSSNVVSLDERNREISVKERALPTAPEKTFTFDKVTIATVKVCSHIPFFAPFLSTAPSLFLALHVNSTIEMRSTHI